MSSQLFTISKCHQTFAATWVPWWSASVPTCLYHVRSNKPMLGPGAGWAWWRQAKLPRLRWDRRLFLEQVDVVGGFNPSENIHGSFFPIYGKIKFMFQTTNQINYSNGCHAGWLQLAPTALEANEAKNGHQSPRLPNHIRKGATDYCRLPSVTKSVRIPKWSSDPSAS